MLNFSTTDLSDVRLPAFADYYVMVRLGEIKSHRVVELTLARMGSLLPDVPLVQIRRNDIASYVMNRRESGVSNGTINCELLTLSAAINYAKKRWGWEINNPVPGQYLRWPTGRLRYLKQVEAELLIQGAGQATHKGHEVLADFIRLAINTGMRKNEMLCLTWDRVEVDQALVILTSKDTKTTRPRMVPLNHQAVAVMNRRLDFCRRKCPASIWVFSDESGQQVRNIYPAWWETLERVGIEDFRIHDLRHTFASWLVMRGVSLYVVRDLLGHSSIKMTERYAHLANSALIEAVAVLNS